MITKEKVEKLLRERPGLTQKEMAIHFAMQMQGDSVYGTHKYVASAVGELRAEGKLPDVNRCSVCNGAMTRGQRNVKLFLI